ncbi:MAG: peptidoglycan DD-metalloendopeptidase family protein [Lachnospiraceae bacterium]|nr:peptidoglycan DD-metalloendopeptidase family protein [Lachnospiraceae bacterium]
MNRRTWKEWITKRNTIWTLSLCLVGVIVLGGMAAVNSSRSSDNTQTETELGQVAYLEEDPETNPDEETANDEDADMDADTVTDVTADGSNSAADGTAAEDVTTDLILGDDSVIDTGSSTGTDGTAAESSLDGDASGTGSNASADGIISDTGESSDNVASDNDESSEDVTSNDYESSDGAASNDAESPEDTASAAADSDDFAASDTEEASSASIISEQALIDAGVSFTDDQSLLWPSAGTIAIDYSMDKSVYFATLNQYKYNPALIISSETGNQVLAAAKGIVESISVDEETGTTLVLNIGNGYRLTYGQLMEPAVSEGDVVESGDLLAYISEPTKYYSTEGSNLYFAMTKDGEPVDPVLYLE